MEFIPSYYSSMFILNWFKHKRMKVTPRKYHLFITENTKNSFKDGKKKSQTVKRIEKLLGTESFCMEEIPESTYCK